MMAEWQVVLLIVGGALLLIAFIGYRMLAVPPRSPQDAEDTPHVRDLISSSSLLSKSGQNSRSTSTRGTSENWSWSQADRSVSETLSKEDSFPANDDWSNIRSDTSELTGRVASFR